MRTLFALLLAFLLLTAGTAFAGDPPKVGQKVPDFTATTIQGQTLKLSEILATDNVILWFSNFCDACQAEFGDFQYLYRFCEGHGVKVIVVSTLQTDTLKVRAALKAKPMYKFPVILDTEGKLCDLYGSLVNSDACPMTNLYAIDKKGVCVISDHLPGPAKAPLMEWAEKNGCTLRQ